jgi:hypothetical protein
MLINKNNGKRKLPINLFISRLMSSYNYILFGTRKILCICDVWWDRDGGVGNRMGHGGANEESR